MIRICYQPKIIKQAYIMSSSVVKRTDKDILLGVALHTTKSAHSRIAYSTETVALSLSRKASKRKLDKDVDPSTEEAKWYENKLKQAKEKSITPEMNIDTLLQKLQTNLKDSTRIDENGSIGYRLIREIKK
jgi:hypothetical protein